MILHLVPQETKLFIPFFVQQVMEGEHAGNNIIMCYRGQMSLPSGIIPEATPEGVVACIRKNNISRVILHTLQPRLYPIIRAIKQAKSDCKIEWIYWGENYENSVDIYGPRTLQEVMIGKGIPEWTWSLLRKTGLVTVLSNLRGKAHRYKVSQYAKQIDVMWHWSRFDYERVKEGLKCPELQYGGDFVYESSCDFRGDVGSKIIESDIECSPASCVVVGHSGAVGNNHLDALPHVCDFAVKHRKTVVCPLSYTTENVRHVKAIKAYLEGVPNLSYRILSKFYPAPDYTAFLSKCGAYVAPGIGNIGGGNVTIYIGAGGIPLVTDRNSIAKVFTEHGAEVAIYKKPQEIAEMLPVLLGRRNPENTQIVQKYWAYVRDSKLLDKILV